MPTPSLGPQNGDKRPPQPWGGEEGMGTELPRPDQGRCPQRFCGQTHLIFYS